VARRCARDPGARSGPPCPRRPARPRGSDQQDVSRLDVAVHHAVPSAADGSRVRERGIGHRCARCGAGRSARGGTPGRPRGAGRSTRRGALRNQPRRRAATSRFLRRIAIPRLQHVRRLTALICEADKPCVHVTVRPGLGYARHSLTQTHPEARLVVRRVPGRWASSGQKRPGTPPGFASPVPRWVPRPSGGLPPATGRPTRRGRAGPRSGVIVRDPAWASGDRRRGRAGTGDQGGRRARPRRSAWASASNGWSACRGGRGCAARRSSRSRVAPPRGGGRRTALRRLGLVAGVLAAWRARCSGRGRCPAVGRPDGRDGATPPVLRS
jgi:hypothetical protein